MFLYAAAGALTMLVSIITLNTTFAADLPVENPPASQPSVVVGALDKQGLYIIRNHIPADGLVKPHQHPDARHISIISGTLYVCNTGTVSAATTVAHKPGEFFTIAPNTTHCSWAKDGDVDYLEVGVGPSGTKFVEK
jgi:quercetin dioxygenase-like cupin family protein